MLYNKLNHIAFIMDGNKRWAKENNLEEYSGYKKGVEKLFEIIDYFFELKVKYLSFYALSSENYNRGKINIIFNLINSNKKEFLEKVKSQNQIRYKIIGVRKNLSKNIIEYFDEIEKVTMNNVGLNVNIVFNYGIEGEIKEIFKKFIENNYNYNDLNYKTIKKLSLLSNQPDPDLLIRTGGYQRLSNFYLIYLSYCELFFTKTLWPDLKTSEVKKIISKYEKTLRKYGL